MANVNEPFGFRQIGSASSVTPNFSLTKRRIAYNDSTAIFYGDPVRWTVNTPTGYVTLCGTSDIPGSYNASLAGIFYGCEYISTAQKRKVWSPYWPGSDTAYDVVAYVCDDPFAKFIVQTDSTGITITNKNSWGTTKLNQFAPFVAGSGNTATGQSTAYLNSTTVTTAATPFVVLDIVTDLGAPDPTAGYDWVVVGFNNEYLNRSSATGMT